MTKRCTNKIWLALLLCALTSSSSFVSSVYSAATLPRFVADELTITDTQSGIQWLRDANSAGRLLSWDEAIDYLSVLNNENSGSSSDWRLPTADEVKKLIAAVRQETGVASFTSGTTAASLLRKIGFQNLENEDYWTSTVSLFNAADALYVNMKSGTPDSGNKQASLNVWPVRTLGKKQRK